MALLMPVTPGWQGLPPSGELSTSPSAGNPKGWCSLEPPSLTSTRNPGAHVPLGPWHCPSPAPIPCQLCVTAASACTALQTPAGESPTGESLWFDEEKQPPDMPCAQPFLAWPRGWLQCQEGTAMSTLRPTSSYGVASMGQQWLILSAPRGHPGDEATGTVTPRMDT